MTGIVERMNLEKGYGFIRPSVGGRNVFVHMRQVIEGELVDGVTVSYELASDRQGRRCADQVRVLSGVEESLDKAA